MKNRGTTCRKVFNKKNIIYWNEHPIKSIKSFSGWNVDEFVPNWVAIMFLIEFTIIFTIFPCVYTLIYALTSNRLNSEALSTCIAIIEIAPIMAFFLMVQILSVMIIIKGIINLVIKLVKFFYKL